MVVFWSTNGFHSISSTLISFLGWMKCVLSTSPLVSNLKSTVTTRVFFGSLDTPIGACNNVVKRRYHIPRHKTPSPFKAQCDGGLQLALFRVEALVVVPLDGFPGGGGDLARSVTKVPELDGAATSACAKKGPSLGSMFKLSA